MNYGYNSYYNQPNYNMNNQQQYNNYGYQQPIAQPKVFPLAVINGSKEANDYFVMPNTGIYLLDINNRMFYEKVADSLGKYTINIFTLSPTQIDQTGQVIKANDNNATKEDINGLINYFNESISKLSQDLQIALNNIKKGE